MDDYIHDLLVRGVAAIKGGEMESGRKTLERVLDLDAGLEDRLDAWWYLSEISEEKSKAREYLENILANEPSDARARRKIAILDGKLKEEEVINPDMLKPSTGGITQGSADRFTCPNCGGKMVFSADGSRIICEFCANRERKGKEIVLAGEQDFFLAMATRKGHSRQMDAITFDCEGCGSEFMLPPTLLTITCPFCGSAYVAKCPDPKSTLQPNGVIPFKISETRVKEILKKWFKLHTPKPPFRVTSGVGMYLPVWSFNIEGPVPYRYQVEKDDKKVTMEGEDFMLESGIRVCATSKIPPGWASEIGNYDNGEVVPYNSSLLADWVAENYQVNVGDASLIARQIALGEMRTKIMISLEGGASGLQVLSSNISVVSYELILLPVWWVIYESGGKRYQTLVNGSNGIVRDERCANQNIGQKLFDFIRRGGKSEFLT
jgi:predicted RNA-binding Zn-ribbon protein involved in translation (DUF1610 family)